MIRQRLQEYFSFTRKERVAVMVLTALVLFLFFLPHFISSTPPALSQQEMQEFRAMAQQLKNTDSTSGENGMESGFAQAGESYQKERAGPAYTLFNFDPNTIGPDEWKRLGLRERTIGTIQKYLSKGGKFHKPDDLKKIYGLRPAEYERIRSYIRIRSEYRMTVYKDDDHRREEPPSTERVAYNVPAFVSKRRMPEPIDINTADTSDWIALPGIGSKLASRIVLFRQKLGGFYTAEQVGETYGLADSVFRQILPFLKPGGPVQRLNINTADLETLKSHPYIRWGLAKAIISYREQHGPFKVVEQLQQVSAITPDQFRKLLPYLDTGFP
jgi:competence protein ComEA